MQSTKTVEFVFNDFSLLVFDEHESFEPGTYTGQDLTRPDLVNLQMMYAQDNRFNDLFHCGATLIAVVLE